MKPTQEYLANINAAAALKRAWARTVQEVLDQFSPKVFGGLPLLALDKTKMSDDVIRKGWTEIKIPITGKKRVLGFFGYARKVTGHVLITGGPSSRGNQIHIIFSKRFSSPISAAACPPDREEVKRQLLANKTLLKQPQEG